MSAEKHPDSPSPERPAGGRRAEAARNDGRILDAARRVFIRGGTDAPVAAIAAEAGVGIGSLYRRFPSKDALLQHLCQQAMEQSIAAAETALATLDAAAEGDGDADSDAGGDAWTALAGYVRACVGFRSGALAPAAGTFPVTDQMIATAVRGHELDEQLIARAHAEGSLRPDVTSVDVLHVVTLFSRRDLPDPGDDRLLAIVLDGLRAPGQTPLAGPPPRWDQVSAPWGAPG